MTTLQFKSNIKCAGCISAVQNELNNLAGVKHWEVDTAHPDKILKIESETGDTKAVITALQSVGYQAELLTT